MQNMVALSMATGNGLFTAPTLHSLIFIVREGTSADPSPYHKHQLGLHEAAKPVWLSAKQRVVSQRVYITLRAFDAYITSALGLPRSR